MLSSTFRSPWLAPLCALSMAAQAAQPMPSLSLSEALDENEAPLLKSTDPGASRFQPVGQLRASSACTATLIAGAHPPSADTRALILTAGHCASHFNTNNVIVDQAAPAGWTYTPAYFTDTQSSHHSFDVARVVYATMKNIDLAVMELDATYGELADEGIHPLPLYATEPLPTTGIEVAHIPIVNVPADEQFMRLSGCYSDTRRPLFESDFPWFWDETVPTVCKGMTGGSSGSPVVLKDSAEVIGVINTVTDPYFNGCGLNRPCELYGTGAIPREGAAYFIPVDRIARALTADSRLDVSLLDLGDGVQLTRNSLWSTQSKVDGGDGEPHPAWWDLTIGAQTEQIRYKAGLAISTDCSDPSGYSDAMDGQNQPLQQLEVPGAEGIYKLCAIGKPADGGPWQSAEDATVALHQIDDTPPALTPSIFVLDDSQDYWLLQGQAYSYEVRADTLKIKYGSRDSTDCNDPAGYISNSRPPILLSKSQAPWRFCVKGADLAGNLAPLYHEDFEL
jgi:V8-like Glu-specific endopeptidase